MLSLWRVGRIDVVIAPAYIGRLNVPPANLADSDLNLIMKRILIFPTFTTALLSGCSVFGIRSGTPEPKFNVIAQFGPVEIRRYAPRIAAETTVDASAEAARNRGFRRLAGYIFGANHGGHSIAMTAPVAQSQSSGGKIAMTAPVAQSKSAQGWTISFYMPAKYTLETLPIPNNSQVRLLTIPAANIAVLRFTGSRSPSAIAREQAKLTNILAASPWHPDGPPDAWFYDPPWTLPFLRRNEIAIPVAKTVP